MKKKSKAVGPPLKKGCLSDQEKRDIETMVDTYNYAEIARKLNRGPATVRKYCQRKGLSNDLVSKRKYTENRAKNNHHLLEMKNQLSIGEYDFAVQVYKGMMEQFGNDIIYSEEVQIIEYCMVTCLLNRVFKREMEIATEVDIQKRYRAEFEKKKDELSKKEPDPDADEEDEADKYDMEDYYTDKIDVVNIAIADLQTEHNQIKKEQISFLDKKESITKALNVSRNQRADQISKVNQNFGDLLLELRKREEFRKQVGLEIERMRIGIKEEYIRLTDIHLFQDNIEDYPILNTEVSGRKENKP